MSRCLRTVVLALLVLLPGARVGADTVTIKNGDTLTGSVVKKKGEVLHFKTSYAGTLKIDWSEVQELRMDEPAEAILDDESRRPVASVGGKTGAESLPPERIATLKPEPWELGTGGKFTGRVNLGVQLEGGNSESDELDADYELAYRRGDHRFRSEGQLEYDRNDDRTTKQDWFLLGKYDYFFSERAYISTVYSLKQEKFADLHLRQFGGMGLGYEFFEGPPRSLLSEIGFAYYHEEFTDGETNSFVGPNWYLKYEQELFDGKLRFYHRNIATISTEDVSRQLWHSWTGFSVPIFGGIVGSTEMELDYDSDPAEDADELDTIFRLKLGYEW